MTNGPSHYYHLDKSTSILKTHRKLVSIFILYFFDEDHASKRNSPRCDAVLRHHIWVCSVCLCPIKRTPGVYGSNGRKSRELVSTDDVLNVDSVTKVLDIFLDAEKNELFFFQSPIQKNDIATKNILQHTSKVYDSLGQFSPVTIGAKKTSWAEWRSG